MRLLYELLYTDALYHCLKALGCGQKNPLGYSLYVDAWRVLVRWNFHPDYIITSASEKCTGEDVIWVSDGISTVPSANTARQRLAHQWCLADSPLAASHFHTTIPAPMKMREVECLLYSSHDVPSCSICHLTRRNLRIPPPVQETRTQPLLVLGEGVSIPKPSQWHASTPCFRAARTVEQLFRALLNRHLDARPPPALHTCADI